MVFLLIVTLVTWASAFVVSRAAVKWVSPPALATGRYVAASLTLLVLAVFVRPQWPSARQWPFLAQAGFFGIGLYNLTFNWGIRTVPAGTTSMILNGAIPLGTALGSMLLLKEKISWRWWFAMACALAGLLAIALGRDGRLGGAGVPFLLVTGACGVILNLAQKPVLTSLGALSTTSWVIWLGTAVLLPWAPDLVTDLKAHPQSIPLVIYLGVVPGALAYLLWSMVLQVFPAGKTSMALFTIPVQVILMGWLFLGEWPGPLSLAGGLLIVMSVAWAAWPRK